MTDFFPLNSIYIYKPKDCSVVQKLVTDASALALYRTVGWAVECNFVDMSVNNFVHYTSQIHSVLVHLIKFCGSHGGETKIKSFWVVMPLMLKNNARRMDLKPWNKRKL